MCNYIEKKYLLNALSGKFTKSLYIRENRNARKQFMLANHKAARAACKTAVCKYTILCTTYITSKIS